jgi:hypothetical protein
MEQRSAADAGNAAANTHIPPSHVRTRFINFTPGRKCRS